MSCLKPHSVIIKAVLVTSDRNHIQTSPRVKKKKKIPLMTHVIQGLVWHFSWIQGPICAPYSTLLCSLWLHSQKGSLSWGRKMARKSHRLPTVLPAGSPYWSTEAFQLALLDHLWSITELSEVACSDHLPSTAVWWVMPLDWHLNQNHL